MADLTKSMNFINEKFSKYEKREKGKRSGHKEIKGSYFRNVLWHKEFRRKSWLTGVGFVKILPGNKWCKRRCKRGYW